MSVGCGLYHAKGSTCRVVFPRWFDAWVAFKSPRRLVAWTVCSGGPKADLCVEALLLSKPTIYMDLFYHYIVCFFIRMRSGRHVVLKDGSEGNI